LLLCPPLLIAGVLPFWRRRDFAAVFAIGGTIAMFSIYFFADWGIGFFDSLVLSRRLIMPAVAFLLVGYADLLAQLFARLPVGAAGARRGRAGAGGDSAGGWRQASTVAGAGASRADSRRGAGSGGGRAGAGGDALRVQDRPAFSRRAIFTTREGDRGKPALVLCHSDTGSYRMSGLLYSCDIPGYRVAESMPDGGYSILTRAAPEN